MPVKCLSHSVWGHVLKALRPRRAPPLPKQVGKVESPYPPKGKRQRTALKEVVQKATLRKVWVGGCRLDRGWASEWRRIPKSLHNLPSGRAPSCLVQGWSSA